MDVKMIENEDQFIEWMRDLDKYSFDPADAMNPLEGWFEYDYDTISFTGYDGEIELKFHEYTAIVAYPISINEFESEIYDLAQVYHNQ